MPRFAAVHSNLGSVLKEQGKLVREREREGGEEMARALVGRLMDLIDPWASWCDLTWRGRCVAWNDKETIG